MSMELVSDPALRLIEAYGKKYTPRGVYDRLRKFISQALSWVRLSRNNEVHVPPEALGTPADILVTSIRRNGDVLFATELISLSNSCKLDKIESIKFVRDLAELFHNLVDPALQLPPGVKKLRIEIHIALGASNDLLTLTEQWKMSTDLASAEAALQGLAECEEFETPLSSWCFKGVALEHEHFDFYHLCWIEPFLVQLFVLLKRGDLTSGDNDEKSIRTSLRHWTHIVGWWHEQVKTSSNAARNRGNFEASILGGWITLIQLESIVVAIKEAAINPKINCQKLLNGLFLLILDGIQEDPNAKDRRLRKLQWPKSMRSVPNEDLVSPNEIQIPAFILEGIEISDELFHLNPQTSEYVLRCLAIHAIKNIDFLHLAKAPATRKTAPLVAFLRPFIEAGEINLLDHLAGTTDAMLVVATCNPPRQNFFDICWCISNFHDEQFIQGKRSCRALYNRFKRQGLVGKYLPECSDETCLAVHLTCLSPKGRSDLALPLDLIRNNIVGVHLPLKESMPKWQRGKPKAWRFSDVLCWIFV